VPVVVCEVGAERLQKGPERAARDGARQQLARPHAFQGEHPEAKEVQRDVWPARRVPGRAPGTPARAAVGDQPGQQVLVTTPSASRPRTPRCGRAAAGSRAGPGPGRFHTCSMVDSPACASLVAPQTSSRRTVRLAAVDRGSTWIVLASCLPISGNRVVAPLMTWLRSDRSVAAISTRNVTRIMDRPLMIQAQPARDLSTADHSAPSIARWVLQGRMACDKGPTAFACWRSRAERWTCRSRASQEEQEMYERVLVAVDESQIAARVLAAAQELARLSSGEVLVLHVWEGEPSSPARSRPTRMLA
jgi:Universal stress protein family